MASVEIAGKKYDVQRFDLVKALRVITLLNIIQKLVPDVAEELAKFAHTYRDQHVEVLDRVQAKMRYGGDMPVYDDDGKPVIVNGKPVTIPAPIERMTEADWERSDHRLSRPEDPSTAALIAAVFPMVAERAEEPMFLLLAVCITPNEDFRRYVKDGVWQDKMRDVADDAIGPAYLEEVMELAVVVGEVIEGQVLSKMENIGERVGKLRSRFVRTRPSATAEAPPSTNTAEGSSISGVSSSPKNTDGPPTPSQPSDGTPSSPSESTGATSETTPSSTEAVSTV